MTHDYKRHGTTTLFAALNILDGTVIGRNSHHATRSSPLLNAIESSPGKVIQPSSTISDPQAPKAPRRAPRYATHPTSAPLRSSPQATRQRLKRGVFRSVVDLQSPSTASSLTQTPTPNHSYGPPTQNALAAVKRGKQTLESVH